MPKKPIDSQSLPTLVDERLNVWGRGLRTQRHRTGARMFHELVGKQAGLRAVLGLARRMRGRQRHIVPPLRYAR